MKDFINRVIFVKTFDFVIKEDKVNKASMIKKLWDNIGHDGKHPA